MGGEHQVKVARIGKVLSAAFGALDFMLCDEIGHLLESEPIGFFIQRGLDEMVAAEARFTSFAIDQGVVKSFEVA